MDGERLLCQRLDKARFGQIASQNLLQTLGVQFLKFGLPFAPIKVDLLPKIFHVDKGRCLWVNSIGSRKRHKLFRASLKPVRPLKSVHERVLILHQGRQSIDFVILFLGKGLVL